MRFCKKRFIFFFSKLFHRNIEEYMYTYQKNCFLTKFVVINKNFIYVIYDLCKNHILYIGLMTKITQKPKYVNDKF